MGNTTSAPPHPSRIQPFRLRGFLAFPVPLPCTLQRQRPRAAERAAEQNRVEMEAASPGPRVAIRHVRREVMLFSLTGLGGFLRSPEGAHVCYSTGAISSLGNMLRLGWQDIASRIPARRETPNFTSKTRGKICEFLSQLGFVAPNWRMLQIPLGGHSMEATGGHKEVPAFALLARLPACSLLSPKSWRCDNEACRALLGSMCCAAHLRVAMPWATPRTISTPLWLVVQRSK